ncbi:MAG: helix-turn-helix domain-containing protein [Reyranella sp.]
MTLAHVHAESGVMHQEIVRIVRKSQAFAICETTRRAVHGAMGAMIDDPKTVGKRLKNLREALGFTSQVAFAKELGIKRNTYNPFETGERELTFETACLIRKKFKLAIDWLFWGDDEELPYHIKVKLEARRQAA